MLLQFIKSPCRQKLDIHAYYLRVIGINEAGKMFKYKILLNIYLISVLSSSIANLIGIDVQTIYRIPFIGIRWIDFAILVVAGLYFYSLTRNFKLIKGSDTIIFLCFIYLLFEIFQLVRTWGDTDLGWQLSGFICTLNFFILIDLLTFKIELQKIANLLTYHLIWGSIILAITHLYLFYSFITGNYILQDLDTRVAIETIGSKETVGTGPLMPFIYMGNLYMLQKPNKIIHKLIFIISIISIYLYLIIIFHRGTLVTIVLLSVIYLIIFSDDITQIFKKFMVLLALIFVGYISFGSILENKGYDPLNKMTEIIAFTFDFDNPDWEKGRSIPKEIAMEAWEKNLWFGVGYNDLYNYGLPEEMGAAHNFIIACLFQRGLIGTTIYLLILTTLFFNCIKLWLRINRYKYLQTDIIKILIVSVFFWLIPFWTQDIIWEKYSLSIQFMYLGFIYNISGQKSFLPIIKPALVNHIIPVSQ